MINERRREKNMYDRTEQQELLTRVPEITITFWILKFFTTAMGESTSDALVFHMNPYLAVMIGAIGFVIALSLKLRLRKYTHLSYWLTALMVAIFGTMAADVVHVAMGVPYRISATFFALMLAAVFIAWYKSEKTLSIHSVNSTRREIFYWAVVFTTFALGTAAGDLTASTFRLGYFESGILFGILIAIVGTAYRISLSFSGGRYKARNAVITYWTAYILTRPFGASFADWMDKPASVGGLGLGDLRVTLFLSIPIMFFLWLLVTGRIDRRRRAIAADNNSGEAFEAK